MLTHNYTSSCHHYAMNTSLSINVCAFYALEIVFHIKKPPLDKRCLSIRETLVEYPFKIRFVRNRSLLYKNLVTVLAPNQ